MKLTRIGLDAFRSYLGVDLPVNGRLVYVSGLNGTGKTTLREAVKWALTGRCAVTDGKGAGAEVLAPGALEKVGVSLDVDGVGTVVRRLPGGLAVEGWTGTSATQQGALYDRLAVQPAFLDAVLDSETYLHLGHAEAKSLVLSLLDVKLQLGDDVYTLGEWDRLYDQAFTDRRTAKARLKDFRMPAAPTGGPMPSLEQVDQQLSRLRDELATLHRTVGQTVGTRASLTAQQAAAKVRDTPRAALSYEDVLEKLRELGDAPEEVEAAPGVASERTIQALTSHDPKAGCVIDCAVECKTAKLQFTKRAKELRASVATAEAPSARGYDRGSLERLRAEHEQVRQVNAEREATYDRVTKELAALPETAEQEAQIATLKARIDKGETVRRDVDAHWRAVEAMKTAEADRTRLQAEVNRLEELVQVMGPNGARVQALAESLGRFAGAVNQFTAPFGWTVTFTAEPWGVTVNDRDVLTYSRSEQFRIGIAVQLAIAHLSGVSFAIVDELDMLDIGNRATMTRMLMTAGLDQVIVLATREPAHALPAGPGIVAYRLGTEQGRTVVLEGTAA